MKTVKAYCVCNSVGELMPDSCGVTPDLSANRFCDTNTIGLKAWGLLKAAGYKVVEVEIREIPDENS